MTGDAGEPIVQVVVTCVPQTGRWRVTTFVESQVQEAWMFDSLQQAQVSIRAACRRLRPPINRGRTTFAGGE